MSEPYFNTPEKIAQLQFHAAQWLGTPFMPNAAVKGVGVSCQQLVGAIYKSTDVFPADFEIPEGPMDWSGAHKNSLVAEFMDAQPGFQTLAFNLQTFLPGDMLGIKLGGCIHHCGLVVAADGKFIHCLRGSGVVFSSLRDASYLSRIGKIWRPIL
jgi:cell wall-associated NlpC family hydrolase